MFNELELKTLKKVVGSQRLQGTNAELKSFIQGLDEIETKIDLELSKIPEVV